MKPALDTTLSSRVIDAISMMVGMPRPSSPMGTPQASWNSTSLLELERLPTLSFRRWMWIGFLPPSGRQRGR